MDGLIKPIYKIVNNAAGVQFSYDVCRKRYRLKQPNGKYFSMAIPIVSTFLFTRIGSQNVKIIWLHYTT